MRRCRPASVKDTSLDGVNDALVGGGFLYSTTGDLTLSAWARAETLNQWGSIFKNWIGQFHLGLDNFSGALSNYIRTASGQTVVIAPSLFPVGVWTHVAVVVNSVTHGQRLFVNGTLVASASFSGTLTANPCLGVGIGVKTNCAGSNAGHLSARVLERPDRRGGCLGRRTDRWPDRKCGRARPCGHSADCGPVRRSHSSTDRRRHDGRALEPRLAQMSRRGSGVDRNRRRAPISSSEGCDATSVTVDTASITFTCTATSAGGPATESVTIKRDTTAPHSQVRSPSADVRSGWL